MEEKIKKKTEFIITDKDEMFEIKLLISAMDFILLFNREKDAIKRDTRLMYGFDKFRKITENIDLKKSDSALNIEKIVCDESMIYALTQMIIISYKYMKSFFLVNPDEKATPEYAEFNYQQREMFNETKDIASGLLIKLCKVQLNLDFILEAIELIFDKKVAQRKIKAENRTAIIILKVDDIAEPVIKAMFNILDNILHNRDRFKFAQDIFDSQYINFEDYLYIQNKLSKIKEGDKLYLTCYECILLYLSLNLAGRNFLSKSSELFEEAIEKNNNEGNEILSSKELRDEYLKRSDELLLKLKKSLSRHKDFMKEIMIMKEWSVDMD